MQFSSHFKEPLHLNRVLSLETEKWTTYNLNWNQYN